jgi:hypothetical protein
MTQVEVTGAREVIDRTAGISAGISGRTRKAIVEIATAIKAYASGGGRKVNVTYDGDGMGATVALVPDVGRSEVDAATFSWAVKNGVEEIVGGSG